MPRLIVDDLAIEVPAGTKVIEAAERLGIMIPRFCYHHALGAVGACRMCAVKFLQGPFKGVQMSCMIDAQDGMVVSTTDEEAVAFRRQVIEWLMVNHPHDCPVCDEGGQCLLQDETVSGGHGKRRFHGKKRTYRDQYLGPFVQHEMNRCIHCYRCSRFYQEYSGYRDLGPLQNANRLYFGRFADGRLESPFSGNLVDICPTGVYTDKTARFKVRRWDLQRAPSLCIHCSLGCNTVASAHFRAIMRIEGRFSEAVNGYFLCDEGRFGFSYTNGGADHARRPRHAEIGGGEAERKAALREAAARLAEIGRDSGPRAVAVLGSARNSLETQCMLARVCRTNDWSGPVFFPDPAALRKTRGAVGRLSGRIAVSLRAIESSDFVIVAGADPLNEGAMAALAIRQASRKGAPVVVIDPRPVSLPLDFEHIPALPGRIESALGSLVGAALREEDEKGLDPEARKFLLSLSGAGETDPALPKIEALSEKLRASKMPVIVCGTGVVRESTPAFAADCALLLTRVQKEAGVFFVLPGANSFSSALLSGPEPLCATEILDRIENGSVRALVAVECDLFRDLPDRGGLDRALSLLDLLVAVDYLPTETVRRASIFLPSSTVFETGSTYINQEGRAQYARPVHRGGIPVWGAHPPRVFRGLAPGSEHRPAWEILWKIAGGPARADAGDAAPMGPGEWIPAEHPALAGINAQTYPVDGVRIVPEKSGGGFSSAPAAQEGENPGELELFLVDRMFETGELSSYSDTLDDAVPEPRLCMHAEDAAEAGLADGDAVSLDLDGGKIAVKLAVSDGMARGAVFLPRDGRFSWRELGTLPATVPLARIRKVVER